MLSATCSIWSRKMKLEVSGETGAIQWPVSFAVIGAKQPEQQE